MPDGRRRATGSSISTDEYMAHDAVALAALVQRGELSASELLEAALARAAAVNPQINAIVIRMDELARERARGPLEGAFAGVPFLIKDLYQDYAGVPATSGSRSWKRAGYIASEHSEIVRRWLAAGLVVFGRTNTPELGAKGITEPDVWGPTRNPWNLAYSPGGSSGGAAAAVAAGIVPVAGASDGGGSIRIPAASTGLFGLKPGRGRTPLGPGTGEVIHGAAQNHVISRSVRDSARMLDVAAGTERGAPFRIAPPERPYFEEVGRDPGRLRIAFCTRSPLGTEVAPEAREAVQHTAALLAGLGHHVEEAEPEIDGIALARDFIQIWFPQLAVHVKEARTRFGAVDSDFELDTLAVEAIAKAQPATDYAQSYVHWQEYGWQLARFFDRYDLYMTPSLALPPPKVGSIKPPAWSENLMRAGIPLGLSRLIPLAKKTIEATTLANLRGVPFTQLANVTGVPAMSVPLASFENGLPLGIQFLADHGGEGRLLSLASQLEQAAPWSTRRPAGLSG